MITFDKGRTYEIFLGGTVQAPTYYAHTHCSCGSTMGSGEWWPSIAAAIIEACGNIEAHEKICKERKGKIL